MFDFSSLFCCNPNCPRRCNDSQNGNGNQNDNGRPQRPMVIVGPRGPRGYTGATGPQGEDGSISSITAILTSGELTSTDVTSGSYLPLTTKLSDENNLVTLNSDYTFTLTEEGVYLAIFTVQLDTSSTATAGTIIISLTDNDGVIYGSQTITDSNRSYPIIGIGYINAVDTSKTYRLSNASSQTITVAPLYDTIQVLIRPSVQIAVLKLN